MAVSISTTAQALDALLKWKNTQSNSHNPQLLPQDEFIYLILTLKNIPQKGGINGARTNPHKIPLPHPLISPSSLPELCLIIDDRPNSNLTSEMSKMKIKADGISVTKVIKFSKLKTDYKPFESKRKLCDSYEMFFADKRVIPLLPKLLGKQFFKKKKLPLPVDLSHKNWKEQIERGCSSGLLFLKTGTCCVIRVAKVSMERDEIVENVSAAIEGAIGIVPKKLLGVRSLHLKFSDSVALPLYQSLPDIKLRIEGRKEEFHDVNHDENIKNDDLGSVESVGKKRKGELNVEKPRKKSVKRIHEVNHDENDGEEIENYDPGSVELAGKKRKGGSNAGKPAKKSGKSMKGNDVKTKISEKKEDEHKGDNVVNTKISKKKAKEQKGDDVNPEISDKKSKKKALEQQGNDVKKDKKKGR